MLRRAWKFPLVVKIRPWFGPLLKRPGRAPPGRFRAFRALQVCSGNRYRLVCFLLLTATALISLPLMVTSFKQRGCVAAAAFLSVLSLSQAQTNPAPAAPAQAPQPIKPGDSSPMMLVQAPVQAATPAGASKPPTATTVASPTLTEPEAAIE